MSIIERFRTAKEHEKKSVGMMRYITYVLAAILVGCVFKYGSFSTESLKPFFLLSAISMFMFFLAQCYQIFRKWKYSDADKKIEMRIRLFWLIAATIVFSVIYFLIH